MEEKERYIIDRFDEDIFDTKKEYYPSNQTICEIINKQDKRIKELEEENGYILFEDGYDKDGNEIYKQVYTTYKEEFTRLILENKKLREENQQLKQQLSEKEKEIESKSGTIKALQNGLCVDLLNKEMLELRNQHQDKISFAVEQLEHIKKKIYNLRYHENKCLNKKDCIEDCLEELNHQIEELKKEMK